MTSSPATAPVPQTITALYFHQERGTQPAFRVGEVVHPVPSSFALARRLLAAGHRPGDLLMVVNREGRQTMASRTLAQLAAWEISEGDRGIVLRRHRPEKAAAFAERVLSQRPVRSGVLNFGDRLGREDPNPNAPHALAVPPRDALTAPIGLT